MLLQAEVLAAPTATVEVLHSFADGEQPYGALVQGGDGNFYGTTFAGGTAGHGTIFKVTRDGVLTTILSFAGADGQGPIAGLSLGGDGNFYGTTESGGTNNKGTAFRLTPAGVLTTLFHFDGINGAFPRAAPLLAGDGRIYGVAGQGGAFGHGTVYRINSPGALTTLFSFDATRGQNPHGALITGADGNFYGTTEGGGTAGLGTVFRISLSGTLASLSSFDGAGRGANPEAALLLASDGSFYGTTQSGGSEGSGTVFRMTQAGAVTHLASFGGARGSAPRSVLTVGSDGNFYGTTRDTIFRVTPGGTLTALYSFSGLAGSPQSGLVRGADGNFYGTTVDGGAAGKGTIFRMLAPPGPPSGLAARAGDGQVALSWSPSATATRYNIYQGSEQGEQADIPVLSEVASANATVTGLTSGTYFFTVTSVSANGESSASNEASVTVNVPNHFVFVPVTDAPAGTVQQSNVVLVEGLLEDSTVPITVEGDTGAAYSLDGAAFTASPGTVNNGTTLRLQVTAAAGSNATTRATVHLGRASRNFSVTTGEPDTEPDPFIFHPAIGVSPATVQVSNSIVVAGLNMPVPVSISGDAGFAYSINGAAFTASSGTVRNGSTVRVRVMAPSTYEASALASLDIGGVTGTFSVTTKADDVPDAFDFSPVVDAATGSAQVSAPILVTGIAAPASISVGGDEGAAYSVNGGPFISDAATVEAGDNVRVRVNAARSGGATTQATLSIGGVSGTFAVTSAEAPAAGGSLNLLCLAALLLLAAAGRKPQAPARS